MNTRLMLVLLGLAIAVPAAAGEPGVDDALGRLIEVYGGERKLRKLDTMVQEWDLLALTGNRPGSDRRSIDFGGRLKVELTYPDKQETRILDGEVGIAIFRGRPPALASEMQRNAMRLQLMRLYSPLALRDRAANIRLDDAGDHLVLTLREHGLSTDYHVNTDNWHIEKIVGTLRINGGAMQFVTEYSEFAMVDGVLVHHRENKFAGGTNTAVLKLKRIEFDVEFSDEDFAPPDVKDATVTASVWPLP
jgi:hypothetical protein